MPPTSPPEVKAGTANNNIKLKNNKMEMKANLLKTMLAAVALALPMGAWAHESGTSPQVKMTWTFDQFVHSGIALQNPAGSSATLCIDGLWLAAASNASEGSNKYSTQRENVTAITKSTKCSDEDVTASGFTTGNYMAVYTNRTGTLKFNTAPSGGSGNCAFGLRFNGPGTIYALVKGTYKASEGRSVAIYDCTKRDDHTEATKEDEVTPTSNSSEWYLLKAIVPASGGIYQIMSTVGGSCYVLGITFIPGTEAAGKNQYDVTLTDGFATYSAAYPCDVPTGVKAYVASSIENGKIMLAEVSEIPANTGVILKADDPETTSVKMKNKLATNYAVGTNRLTPNIGAYALPVSGKDKTTTDYKNYILVKQGEKIVFAPTDGTGNVGANKAFLHVKESEVPTAGAPSLEFVFGSETTGIESVKKDTVNDNRYYNLSGQEVAQPTRGLYIVNGRKVVLK